MAPSKFLWLDIRTGLGELFIQEYHEPYESNFWLHRDQEPQIIMFIGDKTKIISLNRLFSFSADDNHDKIHLREVPGQYGTQSPLLIADCGLHKAASLEKVLAGPVPANIHQSSIVWHHKVSFSHEPYTIANIVYAQLISPFSTLICLFADDLGGIYQVARLLTTWIGIGLLPRDLPPEAYPRLLILKAWDESSDGYFDEKLATHAFLQILNVELKGQELVKDGVRATDLLQRLSSGLNVLALPIVGLRENQTTPSSWVTLRGRIQQDSAEVQERRRAVRTSFHAKHLKALFYSACDHFSADLITPFSFIQASRSCNPVPQGFSKHLTRFLQISKMEEFSIPVIASALVMDSCPPGMHYFEPSAVFHSLYIKILQEVQRSLYPKDHDRFSEIYEQVKDVYCKQASDVFRNKIPSAAAHRTVLAGFSKVWKNYYSYATCFACVARCAERRLSCQHALCEPCIRKHGSTATDDAQQFILNVCPLCLLQNTIKFRIRPDTAGIRGLSICGAVEEDDIAQFLHKLQIELGLIASPLQDHFDIVVGDNSGM
ncbi:hypothetical protein F5884DRAFT_148939 [Xylogone sp. PMI_703]|nr:hypothetical protein F5884DRAFT_148939 [Xylogone sp. PMI_703]